MPIVKEDSSDTDTVLSKAEVLCSITPSDVTQNGGAPAECDEVSLSFLYLRDIHWPSAEQGAALKG